MAVDRNAFTYRFNYALAHGRNLPEPMSDADRRYMKARFRGIEDEEKRKAAAEQVAVARPRYNLSVEWLVPMLGMLYGAGPWGETRLDRKRDGHAVLTFLAPEDQSMLGRPCWLNNVSLGGAMGGGYVPGSEWDLDARVARTMNVLVPQLIADHIWDQFGVPPWGLVEKLQKLRTAAEHKATFDYWKRGWSDRHGEPWKEQTVENGREAYLELAQGPPAASREDRIDHCIRYTFTGRLCRDGRPYVRDLRRVMGMPDITCRERNESYRRVQKGK